MSIIGLSGYAQTGKDTVANYLVEKHGFTRVAFADALRDVLYGTNPIVGFTMHDPAGGAGGSRFEYVVPVKLQEIVDRMGWDYAKTNYPEIRALLQRLGTEGGRNVLGQNVWVDTAMRKVRPGDKVVFTDVRFPNEASAITASHGVIWRIRRHNTDPVNLHVSETALDDWPFALVIDNDGSIEALHSRIELALRGWETP